MTSGMNNVISYVINFVSDNPRSFAASAALAVSTTQIRNSLQEFWNHYSGRGNVLLRFEDNQREVRVGQLNEDVSKNVLKVLNKNKVNGINFNPKKLGPELVEPGVCTAKSLDFIAFCYETVNSVSKSKGDKDRASFILDQFNNWKKQDKQRYIEFRSRQMAFNTIEVTDKSIDHSAKKVEALVAFHGFEISHATKLFDQRKTPILPKDINKLSPGFYFVRLYKPSKVKAKLERFGHSMAYIKVSDQYGFYYDPNDGNKEILGPQGKKVVDIIQKVNQRWGIRKVRLYRLVSENGVPFTEGMHKSYDIWPAVKLSAPASTKIQSKL